MAECYQIPWSYTPPYRVKPPNYYIDFHIDFGCPNLSILNPPPIISRLKSRHGGGPGGCWSSWEIPWASQEIPWAFREVPEAPGNSLELPGNAQDSPEIPLGNYEFYRDFSIADVKSCAQTQTRYSERGVELGSIRKVDMVWGVDDLRKNEAR